MRMKFFKTNAKSSEYLFGATNYFDSKAALPQVGVSREILS